MYLRIKGDSFTENIFKEIEAQTDCSILKIKKIKYDEKNKRIFLPILRYGIKNKRRILGSVLPYKRDKGKKIPSTIIIHNVTSCEIENNFDKNNILEITLLFGLVIKGQEISICSAEEASGKTYYAMRLKISEIDIEISDQ